MITSANTSLNQVPGLHRRFVKAYANRFSNRWVADIGCGRYYKGHDFLRSHGYTVFDYDPYWRTAPVNRDAADTLKEGAIDVALVANVLNVLEDDEAIRRTIYLASLAGEAWFSIYQGDLSGTPRETSRGYQRNWRAEQYREFLRERFNWIERKDNVFICQRTI